MRWLIRQGARDFHVRQHAIDVLMERRVRPKDYPGELRALFEWVQRNVRYTKDPFRIELLHSARKTLELKAGDCDDQAILLGAMLKAIGHPVRLVITGPDPRRPGLFSHVYLEAWVRGSWVPLDPTMPHPMGWAPRTGVRQVIPVDPPRGLANGTRLYRRFMGRPPAAAIRVASPSPPSVVVELGQLVGVMYRSDKWHPGTPRTYLHRFEDPPRLVSNPAGDQLYVVGGGYRVTARGIEG